LYTFLCVIVPYLNTHKSRLGIAPADITRMLDFFGGLTPPPAAHTYLSVYALWADKINTRTSAVIGELDTLEANLVEVITEIMNDIPASKWTDDDRKTLRRKTGADHSHTVPTSKIDASIVVDINSIKNAILEFTARKSTASKRHSLPEGVDIFEVAYAVVVSDARPSNDGFPQVLKTCAGPDDNTTKEKFTKSSGEIQLNATLAGFNVVCWGRWSYLHHPALASDWSIRYTVPIIPA